MNFRSFFSNLWKLLLCALSFFVGLALSGILLPQLGFTPPEIPAGTDAGTITFWFLLGSMVLAAALVPISQRFSASRLARWLYLTLFVWVFSVIGMVLESFFFMKTGAVSSLKNGLFTMLNFLLPTLFMSGMVVNLYLPVSGRKLSLNFAPKNLISWLWRILTALSAYPLIYFSFGLIVQPLIGNYYATSQYELTVPTWRQMIPLQLLRSLLFLLVSLPIIGFWNGSRRVLWLSFGFAIFVCTGFMAVLTAYWFPWQMRLFHGMELLADGMLYSGVLTWLFARLEN